VEPSHFLDDIPDDLLRRQLPSVLTPRQNKVNPFSAERWQPAAASSSAALVQRFQPGQHVEHHVWGEGMVLNSRLQDDDEIVDIFFESVGLKRVAASLAKLTLKP